jgi:hypothetical protein
LTAEPVALRVAEGLDVAVFVEGTVEVPAFEPDLGGELAPLELFPGDDPGAVVVVDPWVAEAPDREPSVTGADFVWKVSTPMSPTTVAPMTTGARLMESSRS